MKQIVITLDQTIRVQSLALEWMTGDALTFVLRRGHRLEIANKWRGPRLGYEV